MALGPLLTSGMCTAAAGLIAPVEGALVQEAIDGAVILDALRGSRWCRFPRGARQSLDG